jgi:hypothetical protein
VKSERGEKGEAAISLSFFLFRFFSPFTLHPSLFTLSYGRRDCTASASPPLQLGQSARLLPSQPGAPADFFSV